MSLLTSVNAGTPAVNYFIENIGGAGTGAVDAPCIKGSTLGAVRIGDPTDGLVLRGDTIADANIIYGGQAAGGSLTIGNSVASPSQIVLTDGVANVNGLLAVVGSLQAKTAGATPASLDTYTNRDIHGFSDTGYSSFSVPFAGGGPVANPVALSPGLWSVIVVGTGAGNEQAQPSAICYWDGAVWTGNGVGFAFGAGPVGPNCAIAPVAGGATLTIGGAGVPAAGNVFFRQLLAAPNL